jgi:riboflavin kinase/FMN adenylyltransferase
MIVTWLEDVSPRPRRIALGQFDGVHLGHRALIAGCDTVVSFDPHPRTIVAPERPTTILSALERKIELVASLGVRELILVRFDRARAAQSPAAFVSDVLVGRLCATQVSVGENFRFGHRGRGDAAALAADPRFATRALGLVHHRGLPVSSSRIRALVAAGELDAASELLGSRVHVAATISGAPSRTGVRLHFDAHAALPPDGAYACSTALGAATLEIVRSGDGDPWGRLTGVPVAVGSTIELELSRPG